MTSGKITPMMIQYNEIKSNYSDCILFFRLGDFYEMFGDDAVKAAKILDITLTSRTKAVDALPMCGIPYHSAESYVAKLTSQGLKVAICEQFGDPKGPGIVERKVARVVTPSTNLSDYSLEDKANQFIAGLLESKGSFSLVLCDISTSEIFIGEYASFKEIISNLNSYSVKELIAEPSIIENPVYNRILNTELNDCLINSISTKNSYEKAYQKLSQRFKVTTLNSLIIKDSPLQIQTLNYVFDYLEDNLGLKVICNKNLNKLNDSNFFELDQSTIRNLEIFYSNADFSKKGSLLAYIDLTKSAAGGRLLRQRLLRPAKAVAVLENRLDFVAANYNMGAELNEAIELVKQTFDIERVINRVKIGNSGPKELLQIRYTLEVIPQLVEFYESRIAGKSFCEFVKKLNPLSDLRELLERSIKEDQANVKGVGNIFKKGYDPEIDELSELLFEGKEYILKLQNEEIEKTGIANLKISFNKVFGYYIEVSRGKTDMVPDYFIRKQTLTNSERYITPALKEYEEKVLSAESKLKVVENRLFEELCLKVIEFDEELLANAKILAETDLYLSFALLAIKNSYCRPELSEGNELKIENGRHPVVENLVQLGSYIPNDSNFENQYIKLITGPNMGGKSTYLRQNAIIVLMAHMGCYVPADKAQIGVVDQIFTRVGASDNLAKGLSTFMVEMEETAYILKNATSKSLLVLDEIGRGTSTYDGVSLAWSIMEYIHESLNSRTLFATHYHELISLTKDLENAENLSVDVQDDENSNPVFLHKIVNKPVDKSYGLHVATMAGIPTGIISRANELLFDLEKEKKEELTRSHRKIVKEIDPNQNSLFSMKDESAEKLKLALKELEINNMTPIEAMQKLFELKDIID